MMNQPKQELEFLLHQLNIDQTSFTQEELNLLNKGGLPISESEGGDMLTDNETLSNLSASVSQDQSKFHSLSAAGGYQHQRGRKQKEIDSLAMQDYNLAKKQMLLEMRHTKDFGQRRIIELEAEVGKLRDEKRKLENEGDKQRKLFREEMESEQDKTRSQLRGIKSIQKRIEDEAPLMKEKSDNIKEQLKDMEVSENVYLQMRAIPEHKRTLKEYILVKVYDLTLSYITNNSKLLLENQNLSSNLAISSDTIQTKDRELEHTRSTMEERESQHDRMIRDVDRKHRDLLNEYKKLEQNLECVRGKGLKYDEVNERVGELTKKERTLIRDADNTKEYLNTANKHNEGLSREVDNLKTNLDILRRDKEYLSKENIEVTERNKRLEEKNDKLSVDLEETKTKANGYLEKLLNTKDDFSTKYERRYLDELEEIKQRHQREVDTAKTTLSDIYEKRIMYLQEAKEEADFKLTKMEHDLKDKHADFEELLIAHRTSQKHQDDEISCLKTEVRMKTDELQRISALYEDNLSLVKSSQLNTEMQQDKIDLLKSEYYQLESKVRQETADITAQNAVLKERIGSYEMIEKELDEAIMNVGTGEGGSEIGNMLINTIQGAPTASKRRIQQSLLLANRLQVKTGECEGLEREIIKLRKELETIREENAMYKRLVEKTNQPYNYLVGNIETMEKELYQARKQIKDKDIRVETLRKDNDRLKNSKRDLEGDLNKLVNKRDNLEELQSTLYGALQHPGKNIKNDTIRDALRHSMHNKPVHSASLAIPNKSDKKGGTVKSPKGAKNIKIFDAENVPGNTPAWFKALSQKLNQ